MSKKLIFLVAFTTLISCSLTVDPKDLKDQKYSISLNNKEWSEVEAQDSDYAFSHPSGSVLFYNSICKKSSQKDIMILRRNLLQGIKNVKIKEEKKVMIHNREGIYTQAIGFIDGVHVRILSKIFNRNYCSYDVALIIPFKRSYKKLKKEFFRIEKTISFGDST